MFKANEGIKQHQWDRVLRGNFIAITAYLKILKRNEVNRLTIHPKDLEKTIARNPKINRKNVQNMRGNKANRIQKKNTQDQ